MHLPLVLVAHVLEILVLGETTACIMPLDMNTILTEQTNNAKYCCLLLRLLRLFLLLPAPLFSIQIGFV